MVSRVRLHVFGTVLVFIQDANQFRFRFGQSQGRFEWLISSQDQGHFDGIFFSRLRSFLLGDLTVRTNKVITTRTTTTNPICVGVIFYDDHEIVVRPLFSTHKSYLQPTLFLFLSHLIVLASRFGVCRERARQSAEVALNSGPLLYGYV